MYFSAFLERFALLLIAAGVASHLALAVDITGAVSADWKNAPGFYEILTDEPGRNSWPITGATFILMHKMQSDPTKAKEVLKFFEWAYTNGDAMALELDYIPMPDDVVAPVQSAWKSQIKDASGKSIW